MNGQIREKRGLRLELASTLETKHFCSQRRTVAHATRAHSGTYIGSIHHTFSHFLFCCLRCSQLSSLFSSLLRRRFCGQLRSFGGPSQFLFSLLHLPHLISHDFCSASLWSALRLAATRRCGRRRRSGLLRFNRHSLCCRCVALVPLLFLFLRLSLHAKLSRGRLLLCRLPLLLPRSNRFRSFFFCQLVLHRLSLLLAQQQRHAVQLLASSSLCLGVKWRQTFLLSSSVVMLFLRPLFRLCGSGR